MCFYSVLSLTAESSFGALPKVMCWLMPIPLTTLWSAGNLTAHGAMDGVGMLEYLIPTTFQTIIILAVIALLSVILIDYMYKKRGMNDMFRMVKTEIWKLKRYHMIWAGVFLMLLSVLLTLFSTTALDGTVWTFSFFTEQVIKNNVTMIFPMCIAFIAGYIIAREEKDDTLKSILTIPVSYSSLLWGSCLYVHCFLCFLGW